ncbi:MAG: hypothetical protein NVS3B20_18610 [Polyangiales bacterium]
MSAPSRKTIILIDDSELILEMSRSALEGAGFEVLIAKNLDELENARARHPPDLIVLDVQMPEAYGDDVAEILRKVRKVAVPMLLFSSLPDDDLSQRAKDAELDGYVSKRLGVKALVAKVKSLLKVDDEGPVA